MLVSKLCISF